jgi:hypothetical protein
MGSCACTSKAKKAEEERDANLRALFTPENGNKANAKVKTSTKEQTLNNNNNDEKHNNAIKPIKPTGTAQETSSTQPTSTRSEESPAKKSGDLAPVLKELSSSNKQGDAGVDSVDCDEKPNLGHRFTFGRSLRDNTKRISTVDYQFRNFQSFGKLEKSEERLNTQGTHAEDFSIVAHPTFTCIMEKSQQTTPATFILKPEEERKSGMIVFEEPQKANKQPEDIMNVDEMNDVMDQLGYGRFLRDNSKRFSLVARDDLVELRENLTERDNQLKMHNNNNNNNPGLDDTAEKIMDVDDMNKYMDNLGYGRFLRDNCKRQSTIERILKDTQMPTTAV